jgi:hypothetical protein
MSTIGPLRVVLEWTHLQEFDRQIPDCRIVGNRPKHRLSV